MTVIRGGTVVDGTGVAAFLGDVVVEGDRIVDVLHSDEKSGASATLGSQPSTFNFIDASGCLVTPGFVDAQLMRSSSLTLPRTVDAEILRSAELQELARRGDVELVTYRDLA